MADYNQSGGQGYHFSSGHGGGSNSPKKNNSNDWVSWVVMAVFWFIGAWPIGLILLIRNLSRLSAQQKQKFSSDVRQAADQVTRDVKKAAQQVKDEVNKEGAKRAESGEKTGQSRTYQYTSAAPGQTAPKAKKKVKVKGGKGLIVAGSIVAGIFGFSGLMSLLSYSPEGFISCFVFALAGLAMLFAGVGGNRRRERFLNYLAYIGTNKEVDLAHMAASFDVPVRKLCKDLRKMLADGVLPTGYLDLAEGKLFLTEMGYQAPEPEKEPEPMTEEQEDDILRQIRQVNDDIPDAVMSAKIDRIEEITGKILAYQKNHPEKAGQLRSFLNYYLPTTLKILRAYAQLDAQGIEGENISAAKGRIEGMMDQVVEGFEKQLDKLFQDDAMDIHSDVQVLENMLKKDGLSGDDGMTMTM